MNAIRSDLPGFNNGSARSAARPAARRPALSPSKHNNGSSTSFHKASICFSVNAVPSGATAAGNPPRSRAITSIYPSATIISGASRQASRALARLYKMLRLSKSGVSRELRYLGSPSPMTRPPNAMTRPRRSVIGNIARPRKKSYGARPSRPGAYPRRNLAIVSESRPRCVK